MKFGGGCQLLKSRIEPSFKGEMVLMDCVAIERIKSFFAVDVCRA